MTVFGLHLTPGDIFIGALLLGWLIARERRHQHNLKQHRGRR